MRLHLSYRARQMYQMYALWPFFNCAVLTKIDHQFPGFQKVQFLVHLSGLIWQNFSQKIQEIYQYTFTPTCTRGVWKLMGENLKLKLKFVHAPPWLLDHKSFYNVDTWIWNGESSIELVPIEELDMVRDEVTKIFANQEKLKLNLSKLFFLGQWCKGKVS